tara:strand:- start:541 stop:888 length:348 start_codon:yes stop_codon:yes gene_type:complete
VQTTTGTHCAGAAPRGPNETNHEETANRDALEILFAVLIRHAECANEISDLLRAYRASEIDVQEMRERLRRFASRDELEKALGLFWNELASVTTCATQVAGHLAPKSHVSSFAWH